MNFRQDESKTTAPAFPGKGNLFWGGVGGALSSLVGLIRKLGVPPHWLACAVSSRGRGVDKIRRIPRSLAGGACKIGRVLAGAKRCIQQIKTYAARSQNAAFYTIGTSAPLRVSEI